MVRNFLIANSELTVAARCHCRFNDDNLGEHWYNYLHKIGGGVGSANITGTLTTVLHGMVFLLSRTLLQPKTTLYPI
jgi:hypothetical protein